MRAHNLLIAVALLVGYASATTHEDFLSSSVDTVLNVQNTSTTGDGYGILSKSTTPNGVGVRGIATGTNAAGLWGTASASNSQGVYGYNYYGKAIWGNSVQSAGVYGSSTSGPGVWGYTTGNYGIYGEGGVAGVVGNGTATGVSGSATDHPEPMGVSGIASGGDVAYGVYGSAVFASEENWAGFFDGDVTITGVCDPCTVSDEKLKKNVQNVRGSLAKVMALRPKSYEMRSEEFKGKVNMGKGIRFGLIAQELEKVFPEVVHSITVPAPRTESEMRRGIEKESTQLKGVNYSALIPILIQAIQEQQAEIEALKAGR